MGRLQGQLIALNNDATGIKISAVAVQTQAMGGATEGQDERQQKVAQVGQAGHFVLQICNDLEQLFTI